MKLLEKEKVHYNCHDPAHGRSFDGISMDPHDDLHTQNVSDNDNI